MASQDEIAPITEGGASHANGADAAGEPSQQGGKFEEGEFQRRLLDHLFWQATDPIAVLIGPEHRVERANSALCALFRSTHPAIVGHRFKEILPASLLEELRIPLDDCFGAGRSCRISGRRYVLASDGGRERPVHLALELSPFRAADGNNEGVVVVFRDVGVQMRAHDDIEDHRLRAEAANRAKDEFLAILGHELRNPLAPILTIVELLGRKAGLETSREREILRRQVGHLTRLVDDLMDASRVARGKVSLRREALEIRSVIDDALESCEPILQARSVRPMVDVAEEGLRVHGDPVRLRQIVANLLTNAVKFTPDPGGIRILARAAQERIVIEVQDSGIGISPDFLPRIFESFTQAGQTSDRSVGGLGLGLAIVKGLAELHGGRVEASSDGIGRGSTFRVHLPRLRENDVPATVRPPSETTSGAAHRRFACCLLVDDNRDAADTLRAGLRLLGHDVRVAYDGPSALDLARACEPDIAILDLGLPGMDGYELGAALHAEPGLARLPLIALSGYGGPGDRQRSSKAGFVDHLTKPSSIDRIDAALQRALDVMAR